MSQTTATSLTLNNILVEESGRISDDIYRNTIDTSAWLKLMTQGTWPDEMGDTISVLTYERSLPVGTQKWNRISNDAASTKFCIPDATLVSAAQTLRTYGISHTAVESDPICVNDVRMSFRFREQLANIYANLTENVSLLWRDRNRSEYARIAEHKIVAQRIDATSQLAEGSAFMPAITPTATATPVSRLTQGILDSIYLRLITDGGGQNPMGRENGRPVFTLITSSETSDKIIRETGTRDDFRYSNAVNELLRPLGVERSYRGFYHVIDTFPARYQFTAAGAATVTVAAGGVLTTSATPATPITVGSTIIAGSTAYNVIGVTSATVFTVILPDGSVPPVNASAVVYSVWISVPAYVKEDSWTGKAGSNSRWIVNPAYFTAPYEDSFVYHADVMETLIPRPLSNAGSGVTFNPLTYRGDFKWLNIVDRVENPDGSWGFFRGVLASGSKPKRPQFGYVIRHLRCDAVTLLDCAGTNVDVLGTTP